MLFKYDICIDKIEEEEYIAFKQRVQYFDSECKYDISKEPLQ